MVHAHKHKTVIACEGGQWQPLHMPSRPKARLKARDPGSFKALLVRLNLAGWRELAPRRRTGHHAERARDRSPERYLKKRGKEPVVENPLAEDT